MASAKFKRDEIIVLLGAGASVEAGIPDSNEMVRRVEKATSDGNWKEYLQLYRYLKSSVLFADGIRGITGNDVLFNIERLVNVLDELQKKERHTLYPFVGAWNAKLQELAGSEFESVRNLRERIVNELRMKWVGLDNYDSAEYYRGLIRFQSEFEHTLRVFSLNYDLCVEEACGFDNIQRGFDGQVWDWRMFDENEYNKQDIYLYKLHGSLDWRFDDELKVQYSKSPGGINSDQIALIFGTEYKLQYIDPFLFLAYEFRRWTLEVAKIIVTIGYGFMDEHINGILSQALRHNCKCQLLAVVAPSDVRMQKEIELHIAYQLGVSKDQLNIDTSGARCFLKNHLTVAKLATYLPPEEDLMDEISI